MTHQQRELVATVLITLSGIAGWSFLLYNVYFSLAAPVMG